MSAQEPAAPYVYQPDPPRRDGKFYGVGGPGTEKYRRHRMTKAQAEELCQEIMLRAAGLPAGWPTKEQLRGRS